MLSRGDVKLIQHHFDDILPALGLVPRCVTPNATPTAGEGVVGPQLQQTPDR